MYIQDKEEYVVISPTDTKFSKFVEKLAGEHKKLVNRHLVIDFLNTNFSDEEIITLSNFKELHTASGTSFVVISSKSDIDSFPDDFNIVPTLQEALDVIEMEEIQRDLGF